MYEHMICVTNRHLCTDDFYDRLKKIVEEKKPKAILLREKDLSEEEYEKMLYACKEICGEKVPLIAHTYLQAAKRAGIKGIHLPLPFLRSCRLETEDRPVLEYFSEIGTSIHDVTEALEAQQLGASYLFAGHIFATDCKKGIPGRGLTFLSKVCQEVSIPVYAIGGMNEKNLPLMMKMGAAGSCMMSGFMKEV